MRHTLSYALAKHKDQPLTLDVARQILADVDADRSIDPMQFRPQDFEGYRLQCERVAGIEADLDPLHRGYAQATNPHGADLPFPYARLREAERAGSVLMATARHSASGALVGLMRVRVYQRMDCDILGLMDDQFFVLPEHRVSMLPSSLWRYCERCAFQIGVREAEIRTNEHSEALAHFFGYRKVASIQQKVAHDASDYTSVPTRHATGVARESLASN